MNADHLTTHLRRIAGFADWLTPDRLTLDQFTGDFARGQFLEKSCRTSEAFSAFNFLMGRNSVYHCRTQMPNNVIIGRHCSVNALALIGAVRHPTQRLTTGMLNVDQDARDELSQAEMFASFQPTVLGCDVLVGANAVISQGCLVGHGACIGAGSVVMDHVPHYAIVGGVPARVIKYRFPPELCQRLLASAWWSLPQDVVDTLVPDDIEASLTIAENHWREVRE